MNPSLRGRPLFERASRGEGHEEPAKKFQLVVETFIIVLIVTHVFAELFRELRWLGQPGMGVPTSHIPHKMGFK